MRKTRKKKLSLKKINVASIEELHSVKGKSEGRTFLCSAKTYPPDICVHTFQNGC